MPTKTYTSQKDPPEGSRKVIEHELERKAKEREATRKQPKDKKEPRTAGRPPHEAKERGTKSVR